MYLSVNMEKQSFHDATKKKVILQIDKIRVYVCVGYFAHDWFRQIILTKGVHFSVSVALGFPPYCISNFIISSESSIQH